MTNQYKNILINANSNVVSGYFKIDSNLSESMSPGIRTSGNLAGGVAFLECLDPSKHPRYADNSYNSADWSPSDDILKENGYEEFSRSRLFFRVKLSGVGQGASFNVQLIKNYV